MANFTLLRALGWALKSRLYSSEMQQFDARWPKVPNFAEGSDHASSAPVKLGGSGLWLYNLFRMDGTETMNGIVNVSNSLGFGAVNFGSNTNLTMQSGSHATWQSGSLISITGPSKTSLQLSVLTSRWDFTTSALNLDVNSGIDVKGVATFETGSSVGLFGATTIADAGMGGSNGKLTVGSAFFGTGYIIVTQDGSITLQSGGVLAASAGSTISLVTSSIVTDNSSWTRNGGTHLFNNSSILQMAGTSILQLSGTSQLRVGATASILFGSGGKLDGAIEIPNTATLNIDTDIERTGADIPSGAGAYTAKRPQVAAPTTTGVTLDCKTGDIFKIGVLPGDVDIILGIPSVPITVIFYVINSSAQGHDYSIYTPASHGTGQWVVQFSNSTSNGPGIAVLQYTGTVWSLVSARGSAQHWDNAFADWLGA